VMKPVMASLKTRYGDRVQYHYHEFNHPDAAKVTADFAIRAHPEIFLLDRNGRVVRKFMGVVSGDVLEAAIDGLLPSGAGAGAGATVSSPTQRDAGAGAVEIEVTLLPPGSPQAARYAAGGQTVFLVAMNTHSVDLSGYDLVQLSELRAGGRRLAPLRWVATSESGHHRSGALIFPEVDRAAGLEVRMMTVAGVPVRLFRWGP